MVLCNRKKDHCHTEREWYTRKTAVFLFTFPIPFFPIEDSLLVLYHMVEAASQTLALLLGEVGFYFALCMRRTSLQRELHIHVNGSLKLDDSKCHKDKFIFRKHSTVQDQLQNPVIQDMEIYCNKKQIFSQKSAQKNITTEHQTDKVSPISKVTDCALSELTPPRVSSCCKFLSFLRVQVGQ